MEKVTDTSSNIFTAIFSRLSAKGLSPVETLRLIEDVFTIIGEGGDFTVTFVNDALEGLGWKEGIIDEINFELIIFLLVSKNDYEVKRITLR